MQTRLPKHTIVLLGIGHTNAHIARMWRMKRPKDAQLICVSNRWKASYSGMLPGVLSGQYEPERMNIDLARFCAAVGARLIVDEVTGLDLEKRQLQFAERAEISFDALSIGIGSIPSRQGVEDDGSIITIKPMQTFLERLQSALGELAHIDSTRPIQLAVVGAGCGGTEIVFCLQHSLKRWFPDLEINLKLITSASQVANGCIPKTVSLVETELRRASIGQYTNRRVARVADGKLYFNDGEAIDIDLAIWATGATAPPLLAKLGLETDESGFLKTDEFLQVAGQPNIFAVGDTGTMQDSPTPKAGVYAVRQGPILWRNIKAAIDKQPLTRYVPQRDFLTLLNLGDGRAIAQYKGNAFVGGWCWRLKDYIDRKFMKMYQNYKPMEMEIEPMDPETAMRCTGCGGKVGGSVLSRVLHRLDVPQSEHVLVGLDQPDDAAVVQIPEGRPVTATADFFTAPLDDPYIVGRLAALNSASDVFAIGGKPLAALAIATIPFGSTRRQEEVLYQTLAGSMHEFRKMDCSLVGGHTIEGPTLTIGFTVLADQGDGPPLTKGRLESGDRLILSKPLGSGILLAAHMQALCHADWMEELMAAMLVSNQVAVEAIDSIPIASLTDVTGFGLAGHLLEMLKASNVSACLNVDSVPLLAGVSELLEQGIESTLAPANRDAETSIKVTEKLRKRPEYQVLFDPQTCGGMLFGIAPEYVSTTRELLAKVGIKCADIGEVVEDSGSSRIKVV